MRIKRTRYQWFTGICLLLASAQATAAPQYIPIRERVREAPVIIVAKILKYKKVAAKPLPNRYTLKLRIKTREILKGKAPRAFELPLIIEPRGYGNYLPEPPPPGVYILFLIHDKKKKPRAKSPGRLLPYAPQNFFYLFYNPRNMRETTLHLLK